MDTSGVYSSAPQMTMPPGDRARGEIELGGQGIGGGDLLELGIGSGGGDAERHGLAENHAGRIDQVNAPVHKVAVAVFLFEAPGHVADLRAIRQLGGRAAPEVPIQGRGRVLGLGVFEAGGVMNLDIGLDDRGRGCPA